MTQYVYSGRSRPCPICDRTKDPDCRWNDEVVFCHTTSIRMLALRATSIAGPPLTVCGGSISRHQPSQRSPLVPSSGRTSFIRLGRDSPW
jgi:hypothetical protein